MQTFMALIGLCLIILIGFLCSSNKSLIKWRLIIGAFILQFIFALFLLKSGIVSTTCMCILSFLIIEYIAHTTLQNSIKSKSMLSLAGVVLFLVLVFFPILIHPIANIVGTIGYIYLLYIVLRWIVLKSIHHWKIESMKDLKNKLISRLDVYFVLLYVGLGTGAMIVHHLDGVVLIQVVSDVVSQILGYGNEGAKFIFGNVLTDPSSPTGFVFAISVLPAIVYMSMVFSMLYYFGFIQALVQALANFMKWILGQGGPDILAVSANIFIGQTEAPLLVLPYLRHMTLSQINTVMVGGYATIAGSVMAGYIIMGIDASYLIGASLMSAPAALALSKLFYPEDNAEKAEEAIELSDNYNPETGKEEKKNLLEYMVEGTKNGLMLALNVGAMLVAFVALIALLNAGFAAIHDVWNFMPKDLSALLGMIFKPFALLLGIAPQDAAAAGNFIALKVAINEFVAYSEFVKAMPTLAQSSIVIITYALCGFSNFGSIGIQVGGMSALVPERSKDFAYLGLRAMCIGLLASLSTAAVVGIILGI